MRFEPTMKQAVIRRTARKYAEEVLAPAAVEMDKTGQFPQGIADEMAVSIISDWRFHPNMGVLGWTR